LKISRSFFFFLVLTKLRHFRQKRDKWIPLYTL